MCWPGVVLQDSLPLRALLQAGGRRDRGILFWVLGQRSAYHLQFQFGVLCDSGHTWERTTSSWLGLCRACGHSDGGDLPAVTEQWGCP